MKRNARVRGRSLLLDYTSSDYALLERGSLIKNLRCGLSDGRSRKSLKKKLVLIKELNEKDLIKMYSELFSFR